MSHYQQLTHQFDTRSSTFNDSAHWITDEALVRAHTELAGRPHGDALEMCCGTGVLSNALQAQGWKITGLDISEGMVAEAKRNVPAVQGNVEALPFKDQTFDLIVMRQALFLVGDSSKTLKEVARVLKPDGRFIISQLIPYGADDAPHLEKVHRTKQAQLRRFYTRENLKEELAAHRLIVKNSKEVTVRESVTLWMDQAPELTPAVRKSVCDLVVQGPKEYAKHHNVDTSSGEIIEDWNFVVYETQLQRDN